MNHLPSPWGSHGSLPFIASPQIVFSLNWQGGTVRALCQLRSRGLVVGQATEKQEVEIFSNTNLWPGDLYLSHSQQTWLKSWYSWAMLGLGGWEEPRVAGSGLPFYAKHRVFLLTLRAQGVLATLFRRPWSLTTLTWKQLVSWLMVKAHQDPNPALTFEMYDLSYFRS